MRTILLCGVLIAAPIIGVSKQGAPANAFIKLSFSVDGTPTSCDGFHVELRLNGESFTPKQDGQRFEIPDAFKVTPRHWKDNQHVEISLTCSGHTLVFPNQHPAFVREGDWQLGIAQPLYAVKQYAYTHAFDRGAWLGYLVFEGEPGVITFSSQPDPPVGLSDALQKELPNAPAGRARDIAYVLAVFEVEYEKNRDHLLSSLNTCLAKPKDSPEDAVCDGDLLSFVTNLYWRGDATLLVRLLEIADSRRDVIDEVGTFYAELLDRRGIDTLNAMENLPDAKQQLVCRLADDDDLRIDAPKRARIVAFLRNKGGAPATPCLKALGISQ